MGTSKKPSFFTSTLEIEFLEAPKNYPFIEIKNSSLLRVPFIFD